MLWFLANVTVSLGQHTHSDCIFFNWCQRLTCKIGKIFKTESQTRFLGTTFISYEEHKLTIILPLKQFNCTLVITPCIIFSVRYLQPRHNLQSNLPYRASVYNKSLSIMDSFLFFLLWIMHTIWTCVYTCRGQLLIKGTFSSSHQCLSCTGFTTI